MDLRLPVILKDFKSVQDLKEFPERLPAFLCVIFRRCKKFQAVFEPVPHIFPFIALQETVRIVERPVVDPLLKIMGEGKGGRRADIHRMRAVLQDPEQDFPGVLQLCKEEVIKIIVRLRLRFSFVRILCMKEPDRFRPSQDNLRGGRTGEGQGDLAQALEFLDMAGIDPACPAECFRTAAFQIQIAQIVFIKKGAAAAVPAETFSIPVDLISQPVF